MHRNAAALLSTLLIPVLLAGCMGAVTKQQTIEPEISDAETLKQRSLAFANIRYHADRLQRIAFPLKAASTPFCQDNQSHESGIHFINRHGFGAHYRQTLETELAATDQLQVMRVIPGSPAAAEGIEPGDLLLSLNDTEVAQGPKALVQFEQQLQDALARSTRLKFSLQRGEQRLERELQTVAVCNYPVYLKLGNALNAYTESGAIYVTKGMIRFTESDQELSLVVAHELAHNLMDHNKAKTTQYVLGSALDLAASAVGVNTKNRFGNAAALSYSQEYEAEADYIGLYIMANADIPVDGTANFWRRMAIEHPASIETSHSASHPSTSSRFLAIEKTIEEIHRKQASGLPLIPEFKEGI